MPNSSVAERKAAENTPAQNIEIQDQLLSVWPRSRSGSMMSRMRCFNSFGPGKPRSRLRSQISSSLTRISKLPPRAGDQRHFAQRLAEGLQQLLCHPAGAQQPVALRAQRMVIRASRPSGGSRLVLCTAQHTHNPVKPEPVEKKITQQVSGVTPSLVFTPTAWRGSGRYGNNRRSRASHAIVN